MNTQLSSASYCVSWNKRPPLPDALSKTHRDSDSNGLPASLVFL